jgi:phage-related baseplate assembly protein
MSRFPFASLDLSLLPAPQVIRPVNYEAIRAGRLAEVVSRWEAARANDPSLPPYDVTASESDPGVILQEEDAYREMLDLQAINDAAHAVMWAFAVGGDLDQLGALIGIRRLTITPADLTATPPLPALMESDQAFRTRGQVALEGTAIGLTGGGYKHIVLQAAPEVRSVGLVKRPGGVIDVILLGRTADGTVSAGVAARVNGILQADDGGQLTDIVSVRSVTPLPYDVVVDAVIPPGPALSAVRANVEAGLAAATAALQAIGGTVTTDALIAAGRVPPISKFVLTSPAADLVAAPDQAPWCRSIMVNLRAVNG